MPKLKRLRNGAYANITKGLTEEQTKILKDLCGDRFEFVQDKDFGNGFGKGGKGGKGKKKKDDF